MIEDLIIIVGTFLTYDVLEKFKEYEWNIYDKKNEINNNFIYFNLGFSIIEIKNIPEGLHTLDLSRNKITEIKNIPEGIHSLQLFNNNITEIKNGVLPQGIRILELSNNKIDEIKEQVLPQCLSILYLHNNKISQENIEHLKKIFKNKDLYI